MKWYKVTGDSKTELTDGKDSFAITGYTNADTAVTLTKSGPTSEDTGTYSCEYQFDDEAHKGVSHNITVARTLKFIYAW